MRPRRVTAGLLTTALVLVAAPADAARLHSQAAAAAQADADLALIQLPAGAVQLAGPPVTSLDQPGQTSAVDSLVDHATFWSVPGQRDIVEQWVDAHPPAGFTGWVHSSGSTPVVMTGFERGASGPDETLLVALVQDGDHVDVRVDAQVVWYPTKTAAEIVPPTLKTATFDYKGPLGGSYQDESTTPKPAHAHLVLTGAKLRRVAADLDALTTTLPGVYSCPSDDGELGRFRATYGGRRIVFSVSLQGCTFVEVTAGGHAQPELRATPKLIADLYTLLGVRETPIPVTPPQGPPPHRAQPHLTLQHNKVQAQRVADAALHDRTTVPVGAANSRALPQLSRPPYTGSGTAVDRAYFFTVKGKVAELTNWLQAHAPKGYVVTEPGKVVHGVRRLALVPTSHPATVTSLLWVSMLQRGGTVVFRIDGQAAWRA